MIPFRTGPAPPGMRMDYSHSPILMRTHFAQPVIASLLRRLPAYPRVVDKSWTPAEATRVVVKWFGNDHIVARNPGPHYLEILGKSLTM